MASRRNTFRNSAAPDAGPFASRADTISEAFAGKGSFAAEAMAFGGGVWSRPLRSIAVAQGTAIVYFVPRDWLRFSATVEVKRIGRLHSPIPGRGLPGWGPVSGAHFAREVNLIAERAR